MCVDDILNVSECPLLALLSFVVLNPLVELGFEGLHVLAIEPFFLEAHFHPANDVTLDNPQVCINPLQDSSGRLIDGQPSSVRPEDPSLLYVEISPFEGCCDLVNGLHRGHAFLGVEPLKKAHEQVISGDRGLSHFPPRL